MKARLPTEEHPAPYPLELASRLVQMFSFTGDTVSTPSPPSGERAGVRWFFTPGTATTMVAALQHGRNSIGVELDTDYCKLAASRLLNENSSLFGQARFQIELKPHAAVEAVALSETAPPYRTRAQKKPNRKRRTSVDCEN